MGIRVNNPPGFYNVYKIVADTNNEVSHTGDLVETTMKSCIIAANSLGLNGGLRIKVGYQKQTLGGGIILFKLKFGGIIIGTSNVAAGVSGFGLKDISLYNNGAANAQRINAMDIFFTNIVNHDNSLGTGVDTTVDVTLEITITLADISDIGKIKQFTIEINPQS